LSVSFELDAAGTTLTATGNGGTPPYAYLWYYPDGDTINTASISVMSGLTYAIYMYDSQGCALEEIYTKVRYPQIIEDTLLFLNNSVF